MSTEMCLVRHKTSEEILRSHPIYAQRPVIVTVVEHGHVAESELKVSGRVHLCGPPLCQVIWTRLLPGTFGISDELNFFGLSRLSPQFEDIAGKRSAL